MNALLTGPELLPVREAMERDGCPRILEGGARIFQPFPRMSLSQKVFFHSLKPALRRFHHRRTFVRRMMASSWWYMFPMLTKSRPRMGPRKAQRMRMLRSLRLGIMFCQLSVLSFVS